MIPETSCSTPLAATDPLSFSLTCRGLPYAVLHWTVCPAVERHTVRCGAAPRLYDDVPAKLSLLCRACWTAHPLPHALIARHAAIQYFLKYPQRRPIIGQARTPPPGAITTHLHIPTGQWCPPHRSRA